MEETEPGVINVGERIHCDHHNGTVIWKGIAKTSHYRPIRRKYFREGRTNGEEALEDPASDPNAPEEMEFLGVEWDSWTKGTHDGTVDGTKYFESKRGSLYEAAMETVLEKSEMIDDPDVRDYMSRHPIYAIINNYGRSTCSLVLEKEARRGVSIAEAVLERYVTDDAPEDADSAPHFTAGGKVHIGHEFVGRSDAVDFFSQTGNLQLLVLHDCRIDRVGQLETLEFPRVKELFLTSNLISDWAVVAEAISHFPVLATLDVSGNIFTSNSSSIALECPTLTTVYINQSQVTLEEAGRILGRLPMLTTLSLCSNGYTDLGSAAELRQLQCLDVADNFLWNWYSILSCVSSSPSLRKLMLANNKLANICVSPRDQARTTIYKAAVEIATQRGGTLDIFHGIEELQLDGNCIYEWETVGQLAIVFPRLRVLRFKLLVPNKELSDSSLSLHRQVLIAIFPQLCVLNGSEVTDNERLNAERYYIRMAYSGSQIFQSVNDPEGLALSHSQRLEQIHGTREEETSDKHKLHSMASRMVRITLIPDADSDSYMKPPVTRSLPVTMSVRDLKSLCSRLFSVDLGDIILVYNDGHMPLCEPMLDEDVEIQNYGLSDGYNIRVQSRLTQN